MVRSIVSLNNSVRVDVGTLSRIPREMALGAILHVGQHVTEKPCLVVKHFRERTRVRKPLSGNGLREIIHVVSRKIPKKGWQNRGAWVYGAGLVRDNARNHKNVLIETCFVVIDTNQGVRDPTDMSAIGLNVPIRQMENPMDVPVTSSLVVT